MKAKGVGVVLYGNKPGFTLPTNIGELGDDITTLDLSNCSLTGTIVFPSYMCVVEELSADIFTCVLQKSFPRSSATSSIWKSSCCSSMASQVQLYAPTYMHCMLLSFYLFCRRVAQGARRPCQFDLSRPVSVPRRVCMFRPTFTLWTGYSSVVCVCAQ